MLIPYKHQEELSDLALQILKDYGLVYFACEERTGKTLAAILTVEKTSERVANVLVITKKGKPLDGWKNTLANFNHNKNYTLINYHSAHKAEGRFDLIILDEAHNYISSVPKPSTIWKRISDITLGKPIIYISATPHAQGMQQLYHQFALSSWSPWNRFSNFYKWFKVYGIPNLINLSGRLQETYSKADQARIKSETTHLFITRTRKELDFEYEPEDKLHYVELNKDTKKLYNNLARYDFAEVADLPPIVCDTAPKLRVSLHQIEGGTLKIDGEPYLLPNQEKIDYILKYFGDSESLVIMYNYVAEKEKLSKHFKKATILQATTNAEGVDLYEYDDLVIYSQDFSTARHTQRRARQANKERTKPIIVHYLLVKGAASARVYKTVSVNKKNFVDTVFEELK